MKKEDYIRELATQRVRHQEKLDGVLEELLLINAATAIVLKQRIDLLSEKIKKEIEEND